MTETQKILAVVFLAIFVISGIILVKAALPIVGKDTDMWGDILNNFLLKGHNTTGNHNFTNLSASSLAIKSGRWADITGYGAKGDGITDDTAAIQAAINNATENGGIVLLPSGDFLISSPLILYSGVVLQGVGAGDSGYPGTRIVASSSLADSAIKYVSSDALNYTAIKNLRIDASNQRAGDGIFIRNPGELTTIDRVVVSGACNNGINIDLNYSASSAVLGVIALNDNGRCGAGAGILINNSYSSSSYITYLSGMDNQDALLRVRGLNSSTLFLIGFDAAKANASKQNYVVWLENGEKGNLIVGSGRVNQSNPSQNGTAVLYNSLGGTSIGKFNILGGISYDESYANYSWYYASDDSSSSNKGFVDLNGQPFSQGSPYFEDGYQPQALEIDGGLRGISGAIHPRYGSNLGIRFSNASIGNDSWELTTSGTNSESVYWRHVRNSADERWFYLFDSAPSPFQYKAILFLPGGNQSSILTLTMNLVAIGKSASIAGRPVSKLEVNGTITLNTTYAVPLIIGKNTSAISCGSTNRGGIIYSSSRHYACDGATWNALY